MEFNVLLFIYYLLLSISGTILDLVSKPVPPLCHVFSSSSAHIHKDLEDVECIVKPFGLLDENVQNLLVEANKSLNSGFLTYAKDLINYNSEAAIERHVINYIEDIICGLGLDKQVSIFVGIEVTRLKPDVWLLTLAGKPFLILEV